jgi:predicted ATP-dependent serine protease
MADLIFIVGNPGTGKSTAIEKLDPNNTTIINVEGKRLPFRGGTKFEIVKTDKSDEIVREMKKASEKHKIIVIDDFQYLMSNEFMRRSSERGYDKFSEIGRHAWDVLETVKDLPDDVLVYVLCHSNMTDDGIERVKTIGKMLDEKINLEGMSAIVLKTVVNDGQYCFSTQNNGKDTVKSPKGMFDSLLIKNDLSYVDAKIRNYYELDNIEVNDEEAKVEEKKRKPRSRREEMEKAVAEANTTESGEAMPWEKAETPETPKRRRRRSV